MNVLQKIFLSSAGDGSISNMWTGILVIALGSLFPTADNESILGVVDILMQVGGLLWSLYGAFMKLYRGRWSAPAI